MEIHYRTSLFCNKLLRGVAKRSNQSLRALPIANHLFWQKQ